MFGKKPRNVVQVREQGRGRRVRSSRTRAHRTRRWRLQDALRARRWTQIWRRGPGRRRLNARFLIRSFMLLTTGAIVAAGVHEWQVRRQSEYLLNEAARADQDERFLDAAQWRRRYLQLRPKDPVVLAQLAENLSRDIIDYSQALETISVLSRAVAMNPDRHDLEARLAELKLLTDSLSAYETAREVLNAQPEDPLAMRVRAMSLDEMTYNNLSKRFTPMDMIEAYKLAVDRDKKNVALALRLAVLLHLHATTLGEREGVDVAVIKERAHYIVDELVELNRDNPLAYLARYGYKQRFPREEVASDAPPDETLARDTEGGPVGKGDSGNHVAPTTAPKSAGLDPDVASALQLDPNNPDARIAAAESLAQGTLYGAEIGLNAVPDRAKLPAIREHLQTAANVSPRDPRPFLGLAQIAWLEGERDRAIAELRAGLTKVGANNQLLNARLATYLAWNGQWEDADRALASLEDVALTLRGKGQQKESTEFNASIHEIRGSFYYSGDNPKHDLARAAESFRLAIESSQNDATKAEAHRRLGLCYARLGLWDLAVHHLAEGDRDDPRAQMARREWAQGLLALGRFQECAELLDGPLKLSERGGATSSADRPELCRARARAALGVQLDRPASKRDWGEFDKWLAEARSADLSSPVPLFLEIERLGLESSGVGASAIDDALDRGAERFGASPLFWSLAFDCQMARHRTSDALVALDRLEAISLPRPDLRARAERAGQSFELDYHASAWPNWSTLSDDDVLLGQTRDSRPLDSKQREQTRAFWKALSLRFPHDPGPLWALAEVAASAGEIDELARLEESLTRLEGTAGPLTLPVRFRRLLARARRGNTSALAEAMGAAQALAAARPGWSASHVALGLTAEMNGSADEAAKEYKLAFDKGDHRPCLVARLLRALHVKRDSNKAFVTLDSLPEQCKSHAAILPIVVELELSRGEVGTALRWAKKAIERDPNDPEGWRLVARVESSSPLPGAGDRAVAALRRALEMAPGSPRLWLAAVYLDVTVPHDDAALRLTESLRSFVEVLSSTEGIAPDARSRLLVAMSLELQGDLFRAEQAYRQLRSFESAGSSELVGRSARLRPEDAPEDLPASWPTDLSALQAQVRTTLSLVQQSRLSSATFWESMFPLSDPRLHCAALAVRGGGAARSAALEALGVDRLPDIRRGDHWLAARLSQLEGRQEAALEHYRAMTAMKPLPEQWIEIGRFAWRAGSLADVQTAIAGLQRVNTPSAKRDALELRVKMLEAESKSAELVPLVMTFLKEAVRDPAELDRRTAEVAQWLRGTKSAPLVTTAFEEWKGKEPAAHGAFTEWLGYQPGRTAEAARQALEQFEKAPDAHGLARLLRLLRRGGAAPDQLEQAERLLGRGVRGDAGADPRVLIELAKLRASQGRYDEADEAARQACENAPRDPRLVAERLLMLRGLRTSLTSRTAVLRRAERAFGPREDYRLARALYALDEGDLAAASSLLEGICFDQENAALRYLYLAAVEFRSGQPTDGSRYLTVARALGLGDLSPLDARTLRDAERAQAGL